MRPDRWQRRRVREAETETPLNSAIALRGRETLGLVERAIRRRETVLAFQPVIQASRPDRPAFYEGLIRILDDSGRIIPARDFIGTIEENELGRSVDCLALEMGLIALSQDPGLRLSINMSARSIAYPRWMQTLKRGLAADATAAERLILEITESSAMLMPDAVSVFMRSLQADGITFALDDFGAGYTSFRHLREFYFDILKIDGQFIRGVSGDADNQCLVRALLSIAHHFDMLAVAESVENPADVAWLASAGVECMQGYYFGAPTITPPWRLPEVSRTA